MSKVYDIAFKIAGKLSGDFASTFKKGQETVARMGDSLATLNAKAAKMDGLVKARKAVGESSREYIRAKEKVAALGRAMSATKEPSAQMVSEFNKAKAALEKSKKALDKNRTSLRELDGQMGTTGTHLRTLIDRQNALAQSADRARAAQQKLAKINERLGKANDAQGKMSEMRSSSAGTLMGVGATVAATAGAPVKQAMSFEDQQAELRKFSDDYKQVFDGIQKLSLQYAKSTEDMTAMAANAFQSGIAKTADEALKLVEIQNQMAIAFDMTGDEVGAAYADIQSKMGINIEQSKAMFDIVNQIGNTTSASAKDVVEVLARSGGALKGLTAMNEKQIAALAGSFRSASVSSEVASTSMMSFINALSSGEGATKGQKKAMEALGIDAGKMAHMMTSSSENAQKAIQDVFKRINGLREDQKSSIIGALFGNEAGVKSAVATLAKQGDLLAGNFAMISDPAQYAGSMLKEFQSRADTTSNSLQIAGNAVKLVAGGIGTALLPAVRKSAEAFVKSSEGVIKWVSENQSLILTAMKVGGAILGSVVTPWLRAFGEPGHLDVQGFPEHPEGNHADEEQHRSCDGRVKGSGLCDGGLENCCDGCDGNGEADADSDAPAERSHESESGRRRHYGFHIAHWCRACCLQKLGRDQGEGCRAVEFVLLELPEYRFGREGKLCDCRWCRQKRLGRLLEPDRLREKRLYRTVVCGLGER